jgi:hypothetical protein
MTPRTTTDLVPTTQLPRLGDFEGKPLVHAFNPSPSDLAYGTSYFGLIETHFWPYGAARTAAGTWYVYFREILGRATTGLGLFGRSDDGPLLPDPRVAELHVGSVLRSATDDLDVFESEGFGSEFRLHVGTDRVEWVEGSHLRLAGPIAGPGLQTLSGWREPDDRAEHMLHVHVGYEVHGEIFGEPVDGYLGLARAFIPDGLEWLDIGKRFGPAPGLCALWVGFLNVYEDGSSERGMFAHGGPANGFRMAAVVQRDGLEFATDRLEVEYRLSASNFFESIAFHVGNGQEWAFSAQRNDYVDFTGTGGDFSLDPPAGYHVNVGSLRRVNDDRSPSLSVAWVEGFPEAWE